MTVFLTQKVAAQIYEGILSKSKEQCHEMR
jgi:hypothetical protein